MQESFKMLDYTCNVLTTRLNTIVKYTRLCQVEGSKIIFKLFNWKVVQQRTLYQLDA